MAATYDYLLDTNVLSSIVFPRSPLHGAMLATLREVGEHKTHIPAIAIAEIRCGMAMAKQPSAEASPRLEAFLRARRIQLAFDRHTVAPYAMLRAEVWRKHGTPRSRGYAERTPEELVDRVSGGALGIDERDLMIASIACQYRLVLATNDQNQGMLRIQEAAGRLDAAGWPYRLLVDVWPHGGASGP